MSDFLYMTGGLFPVPSPLYLLRMHDLGFSGVRTGYTWPDLEVKPGVYDFSKIDPGVQAYLDAGFKVVFNFGGITDSACGGFPTYGGTVAHGCIDFVDPHGGVGAGNLRYRSELPHCANPPLRIDLEALANAGEQCALRSWAKHVTATGFGNEPDDPLNPPKTLVNTRWRGDWRPVGMWAHLLNAAYARGWRRVLPNTKFWGPDTATEGFTAAMWKLQTENILLGTDTLSDPDVKWMSDQWTAVHLYDQLHTHLYAGSGHFPEDALKRVHGNGGVLAWLEEYGFDWSVPLAIGESGIENGEDPRGFLAYVTALYILELFDHITFDHITWMPTHIFFGNGTEAEMALGKYEPNQLYRDAQAMISRLTWRHRGTRS
jgi:hypothetical protein